MFKWLNFIKGNKIPKTGGVFRSDINEANTNSSNSEKDKSVDTIKRKIEARYKKIKCIEEIAVFQSEATRLIMDHVMQSEYKSHKALIREIRFLLHYTFAVLQDDYFLGHKFFKSRMTRIDDYLFSQYSSEPALERNIKKLKIVAASNRFDSRSRKNLLSYFVFMEETGFEIIMLLNDFYTMLENSQKKTTIADWNMKSKLKINKEYKKQDVQINPDSEVLNTLQTQQTSEFFTPLHAQKQILEDLVNQEKQQKQEK